MSACCNDKKDAEPIKENIYAECPLQKQINCQSAKVFIWSASIFDLKLKFQNTVIYLITMIWFRGSHYYRDVIMYVCIMFICTIIKPEFVNIMYYKQIRS